MTIFRSHPFRFAACLGLALLMGGAPLRAIAWSDHASLLWPLLRSMPDMLNATLEVETLASFVADERQGLEALLFDHEEWARDALPHYSPRPAPLAFSAEAPAPRRAFLEAIRVNPRLAYQPYRQVMIGETVPEPLMNWAQLSFLSVGTSHKDTVYVSLPVDARVAPAQVIASASDEPDFGMDIGLFEDNGTDFGRRYGFGAQPFGNPNLEYSSQAPFHMGFYHLGWLVRTAQPDLMRTYPAWRVALFGELSAFAFRTGHGYWGWRFAGWALHYIGDLTQPYHADPLPGIDTLDALWLLVQGRSTEAVQRVSNRHGVLESYQFQRFRAALAATDAAHPLILAVVMTDETVAWDETTLIGPLTRDSVAAGAEMDRVLAHNVPSRFVSDPAFEWTGSGAESVIVDAVRAEGGDDAIAALDAMLATQLARFGRYARSWVKRTQREAGW